MTLTVSNLPPDLDAELQRRAREEGKGLDQVAVEAMRRGLMLSGRDRRDTSGIVGTWVDDPEFDRIRAEHERIDPEDWK